MQRSAVVATALALSTPILAQTYTSTPTGFLSTEGAYYSGRLGSFPGMRMQMVDGEFRNNVMVVKEITLRQDKTNSWTWYGRSWKNLSIEMSDGDYASMSSTFATNVLSTPTQVFSAAVSWPSTKPPVGMPAPWSMKLTFGSSFIYFGTKDFLADFRFTGGTLANNVIWALSSYRGYYVDSYKSGTYGYGAYTYHGKHGSSGGCRDGGSTSINGAYNILNLWNYGPNYSTASYRNKIRLYFDTYYTGPNAMVAHALGAYGSAAGTLFPGVTCNRLYLDLNQPILLFFQKADSKGNSGHVYPSGTAPGLFPSSPALVGIPLWQQSAWADTRNGAMLLTRAISTKIPAVPKDYKRKSTYHYDGARATGYSPSVNSSENPIMRYTQ